MFLFLTAGCGGESTDSGGAACCDPSADPLFLQSTLDDDDGDGNPLDEDFPNINDEDDDIADHAWIRDASGVYHLFFHNEGLGGTGSEIEHYTSADLRSIDYAGVALGKNPNGWDSYALWAPHVVKIDRAYYMFYTGTTGPGEDPSAEQRIGLATSTDLVTWTRYPVNRCPGTSGDGCIYDCAEPWTAWNEPPGSFNRQCRDPFVIWDPAHRRWLMLATAKGRDGSGLVTAAYAGDPAVWTGAGYLDATRRLASGSGGQPTGGQAENAFIVPHFGTYYLFFTDWEDPEDSVTVENPRTTAQFATSYSLEADSSGSAHWVYRGYIPDPGVNAIEVLRKGDLWIMSQSISNERSGYWELRRNLRLKCIDWGEGFTFGTSNLRLPCGPAGLSIHPFGVEPSGRGLERD